MCKIPLGFPDETSSSKLYIAIACVTFILVIGSTLIYWYRRRAGPARQGQCYKSTGYDMPFNIFKD